MIFWNNRFDSFVTRLRAHDIPLRIQLWNSAVDLAGKYGAELHVLAVARPPEFGAEEETEAVIEISRLHYNRLLQPLKSRVAGLTAHFEVMVGHPAELIVLYAEDHGVDHIVVGHRGHSLFERWLLGSVARQVIAYAHCTVTVVR